MGMNPRFLRPLATGFDPRRIAGLELWLDVSDASTLTLSGSTISEIRDKSGKGWKAEQGTGANQPAYAATAINGQGAAVFNGTSNRMTISSFAALGEFTAFAVAYRTWASSGFRAIASYQYSSAAGAVIFLRSGINTNDWQVGDYVLVGDGANTGRAPRSVGPPPSLTGSQPVIFSGIMSSSQSGLWMNGIDVATRVNLAGTPNISSGATLWFGVAAFNNNPNDLWDGGISQFLIYKAALSSSQIKSVENWLAAKYAISMSP